MTRTPPDVPPSTSGDHGQRPGPLRGGELPTRARALGEALIDGASWWRTAPFRERELPWEAAAPALSAWCRSLDAAALRDVEQDPLGAEAPAPWGAWARRLAPLTEVGAFASEELPTFPTRRIPRRKAAQIARFAAVVATEGHAPAEATIVEWCAGVGHLGRLLGDVLDRPVVLVERDPELCRDPDTDVGGGRARHLRADALDVATASAVPRGSVLVGLHACGTLTDRLLDAAITSEAATVAAAPCCLHRLVGTEVYLPRSAAGRAADPRLDHAALRMATRDALHAGARRTRLRARELLLRSAWDLARRRATGVDAHHPLPLLPKHTFELDVGDFLAEMAARLDVPVPDVAADDLEAEARARVLEVRALELPRLLFRRAIEVYVAADRAASLVERGDDVALGTFCDVNDTPRNLLLVARTGVDAGSNADAADFTSVHATS